MTAEDAKHSQADCCSFLLLLRSRITALPATLHSGCSFLLLLRGLNCERSMPGMCTFVVVSFCCSFFAFTVSSRRSCAGCSFLLLLHPAFPSRDIMQIIVEVVVSFCCSFFWLKQLKIDAEIVVVSFCCSFDSRGGSQAGDGGCCSFLLLLHSRVIPKIACAAGAL